LPESSFAYRYQVYKFGLEKWLERPWLGWGTAASRPLIAASGRPELYNHQFGQWMANMHNAYLEILVRFGVVGAALFAAGLWQLVGALRAARRLRRLPEDYWLFLTASLVMTGIWGFGSHFLLEPWRGYWLLLAGVIYSYALHPPQTAGARLGAC
jgi:O-antigen ligase